MKYKELKEFSFLVDENQFVYDYEEEKDQIRIFVKTRKHPQKCPDCGKESIATQSTYIRKIQDLPIKGKTVTIYVTAYKYRCGNPECKRKVFTEDLGFASAGKNRTHRLTELILAVSVFVSFSTAEKILRFMGANVSHDTIRNLVNSIEFKDNQDIEAIGIDDVAIRKGHKYATAIYDLDTGRPQALIKGRKAEDIKEYLENHQKINLVARDRAAGYAKAISEYLNDPDQVADRFHLFEDLFLWMELHFREELPQKAYLDGDRVVDYERMEPPVLKDATKREAQELDYDCSAPKDENGENVPFRKPRYFPRLKELKKKS